MQISDFVNQLKNFNYENAEVSLCDEYSREDFSLSESFCQVDTKNKTIQICPDFEEEESITVKQMIKILEQAKEQFGNYILVDKFLDDDNMGDFEEKNVNTIYLNGDEEYCSIKTSSE